MEESNLPLQEAPSSSTPRLRVAAPKGLRRTLQAGLK